MATPYSASALGAAPLLVPHLTVKRRLQELYAESCSFRIVPMLSRTGSPACRVGGAWLYRATCISTTAIPVEQAPPAQIRRLATMLSFSFKALLAEARMSWGTSRQINSAWPETETLACC